MVDLTIKCDNCGAPLNYDGGEDYHLKCPYCNNTVVVPKEMRPEKEPTHAIRIDASEILDDIAERTPRYSGISILTVAGVSIFLLALILVIFLPAELNIFPDQESGNRGGGKDVTKIVEVSKTPTDTPEPTPTPAYAIPQISFGQKGMNPGQFDDARNIATDGQDTIYVADYRGGRIQAFDMQGKYLRNWYTGDSGSSIQGLAADRNGKFYVSQGGVIFQFDETIDDPINQFSYSNVGDFGDLAVTPKGELVAVWYEGRWGLITELEGHREAVVSFDEQGNVLNVIESPISDQTGSPVIDAQIIVDGKNYLYLLSFSNLYIYTPEGEYRNMMTLYNSESVFSGLWDDLSIDGQGLLNVADSWQVSVFDSGGRYLTDFPVEVSIRSIAVDDFDRIWILSGERVVEYIKYVNGQ